MPVVLVHGNPESPVIWDDLRSHLTRTDVIALKLPGFGCASPDGWTATKEEYVDWLIGELEPIGEPVDLVGHDWGGAFVLRVACTRPDLIRTWASDVVGLLHPEYVWHDFAQIWQTEGAGEAFFENSMTQPLSDRVAMMEMIGMTPSVARSLAEGADAEQARCVLALYRSAAQPAMIAWGDDAEAAAVRPGLAIIPSDDPFTGGIDKSSDMAARLGADSVVLDGLGHWWMLGDPQRGAQVLEEFWFRSAAV